MPIHQNPTSFPQNPVNPGPGYAHRVTVYPGICINADSALIRLPGFGFVLR
jgi:hypothetical protein